MPELPEVETVRLGLIQTIKGKEIAGVKPVWRKSLQNADGKPLQGPALQRNIVKQKIVDIKRRGKVLIVDLSNDYSLLIHLKMTGQLVFVKPQRQIRNSKLKTRNKSQNQKNKRSSKLGFRNSNFELGEAEYRFAGGHPTKSMTKKLPDKSTRVIFKFKDGSQLFFNDQRKFGWIRLTPSSQVASEKFIKSMGPEPLEKTFKFEAFYRSVHSRQAPIKAVLIDQKTLAGLGNIYVDEVLHLAKIHPLTKANSIGRPKAERLFEGIKAILKSALGYGGTTFTNYVNALGLKGNYLDYARVFRREGQLCPVCGTPIKKIRVAGRGTHVCPKCQRLTK